MSIRDELRGGAVALLLLCTACSFFGKSKSRFFAVEPIAGAPVTTVRGTPVAIDSLELPPGFDRREVVARKANHELEIRSADQWSASLEPMVLHALAFDLASRLPEGMVILPGETKPLAPARSLDIIFEDFAAGPESHVVLDARWILHEAGKPDVTRREQVTIDLPSLDSANVAAGMSQAVASIADRIVAQLAGR